MALLPGSARGSYQRSNAWARGYAPGLCIRQQLAVAALFLVIDGNVATFFRLRRLTIIELAYRVVETARGDGPC